MHVLVYDGSFEGFLTAVFEVYEYKFEQVKIQKQNSLISFLFVNIKQVITNDEKSTRVFNKLKEVLGVEGINRILYAFLSETEDAEKHILSVIRYGLSAKSSTVLNDFSNPSVLSLIKLNKSVSREKHRMKAFVRFKETKDDIFFAEIEPDFNVIPLISKHFYNRYKDQKWLIFDKIRNYGIYYNLKKVDVISIDFNNLDAVYKNKEQQYQELWKTYFSKTTIQARKNTKLHIQHVPKRYWKYLIEKQQY